MSYTNTFVRCRDPACDLLPDLALVMDGGLLEDKRIVGQTLCKAKTPQKTKKWIWIVLFALLILGLGFAFWVFRSKGEQPKKNTQPQRQTPLTTFATQKEDPHQTPAPKITHHYSRETTIIPESMEWTTEIVDGRIGKQASKLSTNDNMVTQIEINRQHITLLLARIKEIEEHLHLTRNSEQSLLPKTILNQ